MYCIIVSAACGAITPERPKIANISAFYGNLAVALAAAYFFVYSTVLGAYTYLYKLYKEYVAKGIGAFQSALQILAWFLCHI